MIKLIGEKVLLREATQEDVNELHYWKYEEKNQEAKKWNAPYITEEKLAKEEYMNSWEKEYELFASVPRILAVIIDEKAVGTVSCYWVDKHTNWLETGIVIYDSAYWSGGYGTEAYWMWIDFLFESTSLHRLGMSTWSGNIRMMKTAAKIGMKEEARIREARIVNGNYFDSIKMGILRREWESHRSKSCNRKEYRGERKH
ncbi:Putative ribosomal N-acetyltransferase YdaF [Priestia megaterium Q3]|uniref:Ribosomal N-acetyltransferase YdaF n=1 Tax=Priestia megaterium Q3 TaxID=1452722 RepID=A0A806TKV4_PRIMG|nr:GNAT family protein [Priestia megaterium]AKP78318.1 Putative ribosomal N-acetyltransferase YdaF [Priestia megaterium Q3]MCL9635558.1 GNAT family N-acetyltransferase [Bacillus zanthoxyli]